MYNLAWKAELGGHPLGIPIIYTDPNASDFDESHTQGSDTVNVPHSYFHDSSDGQNRETCPAPRPSAAHPSNPETHGQSHDFETSRDQRHNDTSKQTLESNMDFETAYELVQYSPSRQSDPPIDDGN